MPRPSFRPLGDEAEEKAPLLPLGRSLITVVGIDNYTHHLPPRRCLGEDEVREFLGSRKQATER